MTLTITPRRMALAVFALIVLVVFYLILGVRSGNASAATPAPTNPERNSGITVDGKAEVAGVPDTLKLDLSVVAKAPSVSEALGKANGAADAVQKSLLANGVAKKDLQTSGLSISPSYDYTSKGEPRLNGYEVSESVTAKLRDVARAGAVIGKAVGAGGNAVRVNQINLDLEGTGALVSQARDKAFGDAKTKAEQYAKAAGRSLGEVISITESVAKPAPVDVSASVGAARVKADVPIQPGSQNVSVTVVVTFAMR